MGSRGFVATLMAGVVLTVGPTAAVTASAGGVPPAGATAKAKKPTCKKGRKAVRRKVGRPGHRRTRYVCVKVKKPAKKPTAPTPTVPATTTPAPTAPPAPPPAPPAPQPTPEQRFADLIKGKQLTYYKASSTQTTSRDTQRTSTFCSDGTTFHYRSQVRNSNDFGQTGSDVTADGTWKVTKAEFDDANSAARASVEIAAQGTQTDYSTGGDPTTSPFGGTDTYVIAVVGSKVYVNDEEWGYAPAGC